MNSIYKVIWSKAKNCYVVASEIAKSHTKSASGQSVRRSALASLLALSFLCGGLGVASAALEVVNQSGTPGAVAIYTKDEVDLALAAKGAATDVATNKANIEANKTAINDLKAGDTALNQKIEAEQDARVEFDQALKEKIETEMQDRAEVDQALNEKIEANTTAIGGLTTKDSELEGKIQANKDAIDATNERTSGIEYDKVRDETTIEHNVTVDSIGNVTAKGQLTAQGGVNAGNSDIITTGEVNAGSLNVENASHLKGEVIMDDNLTVKGDTSLKKTDVDGALNAKGDVILGTNTANTVTVNGNADFNEAVNMDKGLTVTGDTKLKATTVDGKLTAGDADLKNTQVGGTLGVTGDTTLDGALTAKGEAKFTENVTVEKDLTVNGKLNVGEIYLENNKLDAATGEKHDSATAITADGISNLAKVTEHGNTTESQFTHNKKGTINYAKVENSTGDWKVSTSKVTADGVSNKMTDSDGNTHTYSQTATESKEQLVNGDKSNFEKKTAEGNTISIKDKDAAGNLKSLTNKQTVDGEKTSVTNNESSSTINQGADQIRHNVTSADGKKSSIEVKAEGITNTSKDGTITNDAKDIVNNATGDMTNDVGGKLTTTVKGQATENFNSGLDTNVTGKENHTVTGDQNIHVTGKQTNEIGGDQENTIGGNQTTTVEGKVKEDYKKDLTTTVGGNELHEVTGTKTENVTGMVKENYSNGQETNVTGNQDIYVSENQTNKIDGNQVNTIGGEQTTTVEGKVKEDYKKDLTTTVGGNELHEVTGTKTENVTGMVTENYGNGQETNVTGDQYLHVTGKQTNKIDGDQENIIGGNQTTTVTGDISNKAKNITNEASDSITDKVGDHTRVLDGDGITDTVGGSTFKQRIDKIMMESKDVSIKAEETLTNEAKVITNKASEVINNEAININNTATGIITSKASEIKNQADKLISNKVGENTWENMENGKITTSIKDGAKQNLTQSDAAGTTQSTVDGGKSTVTIQNADGLTDVVTDGRNTSVQNQTASQIAAAVKDGAGNENASVANATTSANTITNGTKANTVISTADDTRFINSEANTAFEGGTYTDTTIKGNTITTGKVTMDYADVMKDLGVHGSATVDNDLTVGGITKTKTLNVTEDASVGRNLTVGGNATITGDVTANSYKVGDKTYISADGINANNQKITNVADGSISVGSKDAVNGGQLYGVKRDLEHQVDKVGANAAAMANLRPMEFDPSSKWNIAAAIGNYGSETAAAIGAFYRPNDNVMVNLSTAFGTGENMVGGGVSVRLGKGGNKLSREETNALKAQVADLTARMDALLSVLNPNMSKDFPDVPENHWAYEAVSRLAGNDIVQGYPDGEFHGERTMTRYEMAEIIYNALSRGAEAERKLVEEFKPELQAMAASEKSTAEKAEG